MKAQDLYFEGKTKKLYNTDEADKIIIQFLDTLPDSGKKKVTVKGKAEANLAISSYMFEYLASYNVPTHYVKKLDSTSMVAKKLKMIPFKMLVWNVATGPLAKRIGLKEGTILQTPVLELYLKDEKLKNPLINDYHAYTLGLCERNELSAVMRIGTKVNAVLKALFVRKKLTLACFSLEFGRSASQVLLADELSTDTMTIWENLDNDKMEKKSFQITPENAKTLYPKIVERLVK